MIRNHHHNQIAKLEFNYITDNIYIGTNQCCQTHFDEKLAKKGVTADISLEEERIDAPFGVDFYAWIPVKDHTAPSRDKFEFGTHIIEKLVSMKRKIYVHCKNGHGRAPTLVAAYLIKKGKTAEEAVAFIKSKRPTIHLSKSQKLSLQNFAKTN